MAERLLMVQWVVRSIPHGGPDELFIVLASAARLVQQRPWYVHPVCGMMYIKGDPLLLIKMSSPGSGSIWFPL